MTRGIGSVEHHMGFPVTGTDHGDKRGRTTIHILDNQDPAFHDTHELDTDEFEEAVRAGGSMHAAAWHHAGHLMRDHSSPPAHEGAQQADGHAPCGCRARARQCESGGHAGPLGGASEGTVRLRTASVGRDDRASAPASGPPPTGVIAARRGSILLSARRSPDRDRRASLWAALAGP